MDPEQQAQASSGAAAQAQLRGAAAAVRGQFKNVRNLARDWAGNNVPEWVAPKGNLASYGLILATLIAFIITALGFSLVVYLAVTDQTLLKPFLPNDDGGYNDPRKTFWRLPAFVNPIHYNISIEPDIQGGFFTGSAIIELALTSASGQIPLNLAKSTTITSASIYDATNGTWVSATNWNRRRDSYDLSIVDFPYRIQPTESLLFSVTFRGVLSSDMRGIYRSNFIDPVDKQTRTLVATNLLPTDARFVFPCVDDPGRKPSKGITMNIMVPSNPDFTVISNGKLENQIMSGNRTVYTFKTIPGIPTYSVAFAILPKYTFIEGEHKSDANTAVPVRIFVRPGQEPYAQFARNVTLTALPLLEKLFDSAFPDEIGKIDILAIPDFAPGATENWGLIVTRETSLLTDSIALPSLQSQQLIASTIVRKLAQQWFGNLVTPEWWSSVWLSEGLATFCEYQVIDRMFPDWRYSRNFLQEQQKSMAFDALDTVRPVVYNVSSPAEIADLFYPLTFVKSANVLRMLNSVADPDGTKSVMSRPLSSYISTYRKGVATNDNFWARLNQELQLPMEFFGRVTSFASQWMTGAGFPLVTVVSRPGGNYELVQSRFLLSGTETPSVIGVVVNASAAPVAASPVQPSQRWWIPVYYRKPDQAAPSLVSVPLSGTASISLSASQKWAKLNVDNNGYYRVRYPPEMFESISSAMRAELDPSRPASSRFFSDADRAGFLSDALVLSAANYPTPLLEYNLTFSALQMLRNATSYTSWASAIDGLTQLGDLLQDQPCFGNFAYFMTSLVQPGLERLGWGPVTRQMNADWTNCTATAVSASEMTESVDDEMLRSLLLQLSVEFDENAVVSDSSTVARLRTLWQCYTQNDNFILPGSLQPAVFAAQAASGGLRSWNAVLNRYRQVQNAQERLRLLRALASAKRPDLLNTLLRLTLDPNEIRPQDRPIAIAAVAANPYGGRQIAWDFVRQNWLTLSRASVGLGSIITASTSHFSNDFQLREVDNFFASPSSRVAVENAKDLIRRNTAWVSRYSKGVCDILTSQYPA